MWHWEGKNKQLITIEVKFIVFNISEEANQTSDQTLNYTLRHTTDQGPLKHKNFKNSENIGQRQKQSSL